MENDILTILDVFKNKALDDINTDIAIDCDVYESVGKHKLIMAIIKDVKKLFKKGV